MTATRTQVQLTRRSVRNLRPSFCIFISSEVYLFSRRQFAGIRLAGQLVAKGSPFYWLARDKTCHLMFELFGVPADARPTRLDR